MQGYGYDMPYPFVAHSTNITMPHPVSEQDNL